MVVAAPAGQRVIALEPAAVVIPRIHRHKGGIGRRIADLVRAVGAPADHAASEPQPAAMLLSCTHRTPRRIGRYGNPESRRGPGIDRRRPVIHYHRDRCLAQRHPGDSQRVRIHRHGGDGRVGRDRCQRDIVVPIRVDDDDVQLGQVVQRDDLCQGRQRGRGVVGWSLALVAVAPAGHAAVGLDPTGVIPPRADRAKGGGGEGGGHIALAIVIAAPAGDRAVGLDPTGVFIPRTDRYKVGIGGRRALVIGIGAPADHAAIGLEPAAVHRPRTDRDKVGIGG